MTHKSGSQLAKLQFFRVVFEENLYVFIDQRSSESENCKRFPMIISFWANLLKKKNTTFPLGLVEHQNILLFIKNHGGSSNNKPWIFFAQNGKH